MKKVTFVAFALAIAVAGITSSQANPKFKSLETGYFKISEQCTSASDITCSTVVGDICTASDGTTQLFEQNTCNTLYKQ